MHLSTIDSVASTEALHANLKELPAYSTVKGDINNIHWGSTINNHIDILFDAYHVITCNNFQKYIIWKHKEYLDSELASLTYKELMSMVTDKYTYLQNKGLWGVQTQEEKLVTMVAEKEKLKSQLKLSSKLQVDVGRKKKKGAMKDWEKKYNNKKDKGNKKVHKTNKEWKCKAPQNGDSKTKDHNRCT